MTPAAKLWDSRSECPWATSCGAAESLDAALSASLLCSSPDFLHFAHLSSDFRSSALLRIRQRRPPQVDPSARRQQMLRLYCRNYGPFYIYKGNLAGMDLPGTGDTNRFRKVRRRVRSPA